MKYIILTDDRSEDLARQVNDKLAEGWKLQGGVSVNQFDPGKDYDFYHTLLAQAMTKDEPDAAGKAGL